MPPPRPTKRTSPVVLALAFVLLALGGCATFTTVHQPVQDPHEGLRVVSYNIAMERLEDAQDLADLLKHHPALRGFGVLGLQEVCQSSKLLDLLKTTKDRQDSVHFVPDKPPKPNAADGDCNKGLATVSRWPIQARGVIHLPRVRNVQRNAIWTDILWTPGPEHPPRPLRVYNLHLDNASAGIPSAWGRWLQMKRVLAHIERWRNAHPNADIIVLGDFNNFGQEPRQPYPPEATIARVQSKLNSALDHYRATHVSSHQTDWIFYGGQLRLLQAGVARLWRSDHFPVVADLTSTALGPHTP